MTVLLLIIILVLLVVIFNQVERLRDVTQGLETKFRNFVAFKPKEESNEEHERIMKAIDENWQEEVEEDL